MDSPEKVYQLFMGLGYKVLDPSFRGVEAWGLGTKERKSIKEIYTISNYKKRFQIFLVELKNHSSSIIRKLPLYFEKEIQYPFLVITPDYKNYTFLLVKKIREGTGIWNRQIIRLNLDRENSYYTDRLILSEIAINDKIQDPASIYNLIIESFRVEKVSKLFFEDYKKVFFAIRDLLKEQGIGIKDAHEFSQQLLNRIMFIYFIDKKRWLKTSPKFMKWFWERYKKYKEEKGVKDEFYEKWLKILFFKAFNNEYGYPSYLPKDVVDILRLAPYLNGGLFKLSLIHI